jgi:hypothetical protein
MQRRSAPSELVIQPRREVLFTAAAPRRRTCRARIGHDGVCAIMTIGRQASISGTEITVRVAMVEGQCAIDVPRQLLGPTLCFQAIEYMSAVSGPASGS